MSVDWDVPLSNLQLCPLPLYGSQCQRYSSSFGVYGMIFELFLAMFSRSVKKTGSHFCENITPMKQTYANVLHRSIAKRAKNILICSRFRRGHVVWWVIIYVNVWVRVSLRVMVSKFRVIIRVRVKLGIGLDNDSVFLKFLIE